MNQYFLLIACLQLWSLITPVNPASTWGPLIFIFAVSASKEAWDDYNRYLSDKKANEKLVWVVRQGIRKHIQAQDIHVGNIVWLRENDEVPCDLVLIGTSDPQGLCYVETAALDGETDLKTRGVIECPNPDKDITRFDANLRLFPPFIDNDFLNYLFHLSGNETKLGMSRGIPEPKLTAMDAMIDKLTGAIFVFQIVVVMVLGIAGNVWKDTEARKQWYVQYPIEGPWYELLVIPLRFELLCSIMIPISIKGSLLLIATEDTKLLNAVAGSSPDVVQFLTVMAICNTVVPIKSKTGAISYKAQSQDEDALVNAAAQLHMVYANKNANILEIRFNGSVIKYEVLEILEFTSDRKRMSVVVKDCQNGKIVLLSKGADEAILPFAYVGQQTRTFIEAVEQYAQLGLRTLCLACRELREDEYQEWSLLFKEASSTLVDREWRIAEVCQRLEHDFEVLGVTAIEDRLQDGVPETIETLRKAGINFWMLTGDKQNTAIQIALSCNFISPEPKGQLLLIDGKTEDEVCRSLERVLLTMRITSSEPKDVAFVVDGWALEIALKHYRKAFTELAILSRTAICCRVTPSQKAQLVELLKSCDYRTLAIGDGGNDVRMIQQADIGVGISGREGLQAARAADYSIGREFRIVPRMLPSLDNHGHLRCVSGTSLFNSVSLMAYNVFYTSIPVLVSVLDKDLSEGTVMQHPQILFYCQAGRLLNPSTFAGWFGRSLFHVSAILYQSILTDTGCKAIVVFVITIHAYAYEKSEMEELSMVALSGCIWLQAFVVALETNSFTILQHLAIWGNLVAFYVINWIFSAIPASGMYTIMFRLCRHPSYWITMSLIVAAGMGPVLALKYFRYTYRPSKINTLQQAERMGGPILTLGNIEPHPRPMEKVVSPLQISQPKNRNPVYEPLLSDSPNSSRRSLGSGTPFDFFQSQSRLSSSYSRNCKDN
ncbi:hypothetical protein GOBAR_DD09924 [Gossypium barbadense]|nr:hypothetical protein GOBAR_DD09924 [Gossypium barbadense]